MNKCFRTLLQSIGKSQRFQWSTQTKLFVSGQPEGYFGKDAVTHSGMTKTVQFPNDHVNILSFHSLRKSRRLLALVFSPYMYFHDLKPHDFIKYMDVLTFFEGLVYLLDEVNEVDDTGEKLQFDFSDLLTISNKEFEQNVKRNRYLFTMVEFFKDHEFYDKDIDRLLHEAVLFYKLEQWCVRCVTDKKFKGQLNETIIGKANSVRGYDLRIHSLLLYQLTNRPYNHKDLQFLRSQEILFDVLDDVYSYEKDVLKNTFNIYRMYVNLYHDHELCKRNFTKYILSCQQDNRSINDYLREKYPNATDLPVEPETGKPFFQKTKTNEIVLSDVWTFPEPIYDEEDYRKRKKLDNC